MKVAALVPTVYVIDDDPIIQDGIRWLLESVNHKVEIYSDSESFLNAFNIQLIGCILLDVRMPGISGLQVQEQLIKKQNHMPIIIITGHGDIAMAVRAMQMGAMDFITKPFNDQQLLDLVSKALKKDQQNFETHKYVDELNTYFNSLSPRERVILDCIVAGKLNKVIANELDLSIKTVELHRARLMQKMHVKSLAELIKVYVTLQNENKRI